MLVVVAVNFLIRNYIGFAGRGFSLMVAYICVLMRLQTLMLLLLSRYDFAFSALHWYRCAVGKGECCLYHVSIFCVGSV